MELTQDILRELLHYDPETGVFTWRERPEKYFDSGTVHRRWNTRYAGKVAGSKFIRKTTGYVYWRIGIFNKDRIGHRLAWIYMLGDVPEEVDHKNGNALDNRWANLRDGSDSINRHNLSLGRNNTSGYSGVHWQENMGAWMGRVQSHGVVYPLGYFSDKEEAAEAVAKKRKELGFSTRHGQGLAHYAKG